MTLRECVLNEFGLHSEDDEVEVIAWLEKELEISEDEELLKSETEYVTELFGKLQKSNEFEILAHYLDTMFMDKVFNIIKK